jgi:hypothetical protein
MALHIPLEIERGSERSVELLHRRGVEHADALAEPAAVKAAEIAGRDPAVVGDRDGEDVLRVVDRDGRAEQPGAVSTG